MSYIINSSDPFVSIKLTEKGREKLASGKLNFSFFGVGDSEINYTREEIVDANQTIPSLSGSSKILRPFDRQPNLKSYITKAAREPLNILNPSDINVIKACVNNKATDRGFFTGVTSTNYTTLTGSTYVKGYGTIANSSLNGSTTLNIGSGITRSVGDYIMLKVVSNATPSLANTATNNLTPLPYLWYKIESTTSTSVTVDRNLPNYTNESTGLSHVFVYTQGEVADAFGNSTSTSYWDTGTLSFDSSSSVSCSSVPVWNMNNVWCEDLAGLTSSTTSSLYENHTKFGSYQYLGTKNPFFEYLCDSTTSIAANPCGTGVSYEDDVVKSISILHYTNNAISSFYGEYLFVDNTKGKTLSVIIPNIMYHRRNFATATGSQMGMKFIASGATKFVGVSDIEYVDLIEEATYVSDTPKVVGRVYPQTRMIVFHNDEIVAAMSFKSNRNWTLPSLNANLGSPSGGTSTGILAPNETIYLTYSLENNNGTGLMTSLPCQTYVKLENNTSANKDVNFMIGDIDMLPYMRKTESVSYDGTGFHAYQFKLVYQIVADSDTRPNPNAWKVFDYTSTALTTNANTTIDPIKLENQNPSANGFVLTTLVDSGSTKFDITQSLNMPLNTLVGATKLQFGDERFFYGNIETYIGATIFKTLFDIRINSGEFSLTTNPTRSQNATTNPSNIKVSEVGIYDNEKNLVVIGKLSTPISLPNGGQTVMIELSLDF